MTMKQHTRRFAKLTLSALSTVALVAVCSSKAQAASVIKQPGNHPHYDFELEPHLTLDWDDHKHLDSGYGIGIHAAVPLMHQGPIDKINNNMAIKFGFDFTFHDCDHDYHYRWDNRYYAYDHCSAQSFMLPVALQWNFYLTDIITVYGEPGLAIRHYWYEYEHADGTHWEDSETYPLLYFGMGAKFMFGRTAGLNVRLGYPHATVGASILF